MNVPLALGYLEKPYLICKADSGALRFQVSSSNLVNPVFIFLNKECPHEPLYQIILSENSELRNGNTGESVNFEIPNFFRRNNHEFWLTWYNNTIRMGLLNEPALIEYSERNINEQKLIIGFIKFITSSNNDGPNNLVDWSFESSSYIYMTIPIPKKVSKGKLHWVAMKTGDLLPINAFIAGFENEPLYIARAKHSGSLCPGKYKKSTQLAYIPWGHAEHPKNEFEILCGYDAVWVKCTKNRIPENAFIGGTSEVRNEPLFIGRAMIDNDLINGKVHMLYKTCYLPYKGVEVERTVYEILVATHLEPRGESCDPLCYMKMIMRPCI